MPNETVSWPAVAGMVFTVCASIILPVAAALFFKKKTQEPAPQQEESELEQLS